MLLQATFTRSISTAVLLLHVLVLLLPSSSTKTFSWALQSISGSTTIKCESMDNNSNNNNSDRLFFDSWDAENFRFFDSWDPDNHSDHEDNDSCTSIDSKTECLETLGCRWVGHKNIIIPILIIVFVAMMTCAGTALGIYCLCSSWWRSTGDTGEEDQQKEEQDEERAVVKDKDDERMQKSKTIPLKENTLTAFIESQKSNKDSIVIKDPTTTRPMTRPRPMLKVPEEEP